MNWTVLTYVTYLLVSVPLTLGVAMTLSRNGRTFLADVLSGDEELADAVNRLLVVGFYLLNLGFVSLYLRIGTDVVGLREMIEQLSVKIGVVALVVGTVHVGNVFVFNAIRRRHRLDTLRAQQPPMTPAEAYAAAYPGYYAAHQQAQRAVQQVPELYREQPAQPV